MEKTILKELKNKYLQLSKEDKTKGYYNVVMDLHKIIVDMEILEKEKDFLFGTGSDSIYFLYYDNQKDFDRIGIDIIVSPETLFSLADRSDYEDIHGYSLAECKNKDSNGYFCMVYVYKDFDVELYIVEESQQYLVNLTDNEKNILFDCFNNYCMKNEKMNIEECFSRNPNKYNYSLAREQYIDFDLSNNIKFKFRYCDRDYIRSTVSIYESDKGLNIDYDKKNIKETMERFMTNKDIVDNAYREYTEFIERKSFEKYNEYKKSKLLELKKTSAKKSKECYEYDYE